MITHRKQQFQKRIFQRKYIEDQNKINFSSSKSRVELKLLLTQLTIVKMVFNYLLLALRRKRIDKLCDGNIQFLKFYSLRSPFLLKHLWKWRLYLFEFLQYNWMLSSTFRLEVKIISSARSNYVWQFCTQPQT